MREKKWIDCPACGSKKSMKTKKNQQERFNLSGYPPADITGLDGQFCDVCGDGFWSLKSERKITHSLGEHMALHDSTRIVAAELASVQEAAQKLEMTIQGVHKMMEEGRLRYVVAGGKRLPIKKDVFQHTGNVTSAPAWKQG